MYGYTQAKALVYSKYGEPKDVLRYGCYCFCGNSMARKLTRELPAYTSIQFRLRMAPK